jgi:(p)ppGpp synthase/HD superfamily hydrolase
MANPSFPQTLALIEIAHGNQRDRAGQPYTGHLQRVFERAIMRARELHLTWEPLQWERLAHVALLHDILEDTGGNAANLSALGYADDVVRAVQLLTRPGTQSYAEKIGEIARSGNILAIIVKLADNEDNRSRRRDII